jgi:hypothetical protein
MNHGGEEGRKGYHKRSLCGDFKVPFTWCHGALREAEGAISEDPSFQ